MYVLSFPLESPPSFLKLAVTRRWGGGGRDGGAGCEDRGFPPASFIGKYKKNRTKRNP